MKRQYYSVFACAQVFAANDRSAFAIAGSVLIIEGFLLCKVGQCKIDLCDAVFRVFLLRFQLQCFLVSRLPQAGMFSPQEGLSGIGNSGCVQIIKCFLFAISASTLSDLNNFSFRIGFGRLDDNGILIFRFCRFV